jgi:hypothetical protein
MKLPKVEVELALVVTQHLLMVIGGMFLVSFIVTLHWAVALLLTVVIVAGWFLLYKFEEGVRLRWKRAGNGG